MFVDIALFEVVIALFEGVAAVLSEKQSPSTGTQRAMAGRIVAYSETLSGGMGTEVDDCSDAVFSALGIEVVALDNPLLCA